MANFITGITGFCGAHLAKKLLEKGEEVIGLVHDIHPKDALDLLGIKQDVHLVRGDVRDRRLIERVIAQYNVDTIYHLAAITDIRYAQRSPLATFDVNVGGTISILEAVKACGKVSMLYTSTDKVYGDNDLPYTESLPLLAEDPYGVSKACADMICRSYAKMYDLPIVVSRACNIIGEADMRSRIVPNTIRQCLKGKNPIIFKGMNPIREYIYVGDVVNAYMLLVENVEGTKGEAFNVGSGEKYTQTEVVTKILQIGFPKLEPKYVEPWEYKEVKDSYMSSEKIYSALGWKAKVSFEEGLRRVIEWWKNLSK